MTSMKYNLKWDLLEERRLRARMLLLHKAANQTAAINITSSYPTMTRLIATGPDKLHPLHIREFPPRKIYKFSFLPRTTAQWNSLPASIRQSPTIDALKHQLNSSNLLQLTRGGSSSLNLPAALLRISILCWISLSGDCTVANRCRLQSHNHYSFTI